MSMFVRIWASYSMHVVVEENIGKRMVRPSMGLCNDVG